MRFIMWALIVTTLWTASAMAQKECLVNADCMSSQWCYNVSNTCVNYTLCSRYNREESSKPARQANQCGKCIKGYKAELTPDTNEESEICKKAGESAAKGNSTLKWVGSGIGICLAIIIVIIIMWFFHGMIRCKSPCQKIPDIETGTCRLALVEKGNCGSVPSAPSECINNNEYIDAEASNPRFTTTHEFRPNFTKESSRSAKAQAFHPPDNVRVDPGYNPGDNQVVQPFHPPDDEETNPSDWTPGPPTGGGIPTQPFRAIAEEVQDNNSNTAADQRLACPLSSNSQEDQQSGQNNNSSGNSGGFGYTNANGNTRNNNGSLPSQMQIYQCVHIVNQGSNGS